MSWELIVYKYIKSLQKGNNIPSCVRNNMQTATDDETIFNVYFQSVFTESSYVLSPVDELEYSLLADICARITESEVFEALSNLNQRKAVGLDGIGPKVLKYCALPLCEPLCHLFQTSLNSGVIPSEWKLHNISPIYKSGDRSLVSNYRPISLLSSTSKVLERVIYNKCLYPGTKDFECSVWIYEGAILTTATSHLFQSY